MTSSEIRRRFLDFFGERGHRVVRSSSLVPGNDPTLLFTNAGMNQFKDVFLGREKRDYSRACSAQKCVRAGGKHNDLEQVGRTTRHHTFFEMLGNFSFGDYFKIEAIAWAWEFVRRELALPTEKLYVTVLTMSELTPGNVYNGDHESIVQWGSNGVPGNRIFKLGPESNFWAMGDTGPCGPCSEIHYDMGPVASDLGHADCAFPCDCGRYVELWNLVFMQFNRVGSGKQYFDAESQALRYPEYYLEPLPAPSVDTGAGLERLTAVLQGKLSNFETDLFRPLIDYASDLAGRAYGEHPGIDLSLRIIADHSRAATFLIGDGVVPSNEGRGYVLRKIVRRASRHGRMLGLTEPILFRIAGQVAESMRQPYPELMGSIHRISSTIKHEEERYENTVALALKTLNDEVRRAAHTAVQKAEPTGAAQMVLAQRGDGTLQVVGGPPVVLPGDVAFKLYDTYGLSLDLLEDEGSMRGFRVDRVGYEAEMQKQRDRARASWKGAEKKVASPIYQQLAEKQKTTFDGYTQAESRNSRIVALIVNGTSVNEAKPGQAVDIVLDHTPFYAEAGGQIGDIGHLRATDSGEIVAEVKDTYRPVTGLIVHKAVARQTLHVGDVVTAEVNAERRDAIRRNHTATHLLHAALRRTLGTHVKQAGSLVVPDRLRFDFSHYAPLGEQDLLDIEDLVNAHVLKNEEVVTQVMDTEAAVNSGAMALFGEKYGDRVRVVSIEDGSFSKELCGGTHVRRTGDIGLFKITSETSVAAGTRRIEALTGMGVLEAMRREAATLAQLSETLRSKPDELVVAAVKLEESEKKLRKELEAAQMKRATASAGDLVSAAREVKGVRVVAARIDLTDRNAMRQMVDTLRARLESGVIVLGSASSLSDSSGSSAAGAGDKGAKEDNRRVALVAAVTKDLTGRLDAGKIVKAAAAIVEGSGGGRKDLAEAGGKNPAKLDDSIAAIPGIVEKML